MATEFDPYHVWLGIQPAKRPLNHYILLGIADFEDDAKVISNAADRQMSHVRAFQAGKHVEASQKLLNEIAGARVCLLNPAKKAAYDRDLQQAQSAIPPPVARLSTSQVAQEAELARRRRADREPKPTGSPEKPEHVWPVTWAAIIVASGTVLLLLWALVFRGGNEPQQDQQLLAAAQSAESGSRTPEPPIRTKPPALARVSDPVASTSLGPAQEITNSIGMTLKLIPAGEFMMGSPEDEEDRFDNEKQHRVRITRPYYLGVHEVTQEQYEQVIGENPSQFKGSTNPVEMVSWEDAAEFCRKLSAEEGRTYRLPTEAEWEYACRAGTTTPFHFGRVLNGTQANSKGDYPYGTETKGPYLGRTTIVGSYAANAFGLYDMHGNVVEWCADWYDEYDYGKSPTDDPKGPSSGSRRVFRGGCWCYVPGYCRSAFRRAGEPDYRYDFSPGSRISNLGFRIALVPSE